jgi:hypothetical protein
LRGPLREAGGVSADETVRRLIDEHWRATAVAAVHRYRESDPQGWADDLAEADKLTAADAPIGDDWANSNA